MNKKKNNRVIVGLILLILLIIVFLFFKRTRLVSSNKTTGGLSSDIAVTQNWKTYRDDMFKYEVKYPPDWYLLKEAGPVTNFSNYQSGEGDDSIMVSIFRNTDVSNDNLDSRKKYFVDKPTEFKILGDITIDGKPGFEVEFLKEPQREAVIAINPTAQYSDFFIIFVLYSQGQKDRAVDIYQKMLTSLRLL